MVDRLSLYHYSLIPKSITYLPRSGLAGRVSEASAAFHVLCLDTPPPIIVNTHVRRNLDLERAVYTNSP